MSLQKYQAFITSIEYGSITKAANVLGYTQSGVSRMILELEKEWNLSLIKRSKSGVFLTSDGHKLFDQIKRICNEQQILKQYIEDLNDCQSGLLRIGVFSSVATHWLPNIMKRYKNDFPNIQIELLLGDYTEIEEWILEGRVDFGFLRLPSPQKFETLSIEPNDRLMVILPKDHPLADCEKFPMQKLEEYPFILLEKGVNAEISRLFEQTGIHPQINFKTWDDYAIMSMVENGLGISILPELILSRIPYQIIAKELDTPFYRNIGIAMRSQENLPKSAKKFLEYLAYRNC